MTKSSGQAETRSIEWRDCDECGWSGPADVWHDPELRMTGWDCPSCTD